MVKRRRKREASFAATLQCIHKDRHKQDQRKQVHLKRSSLQNPSQLKQSLSGFSGEYDFDFPRTDSERWPLSQDVLESVIPNFLANKVNDYSRLRDIPSVKGTSTFPLLNHIGAVSPRWLAIQLIQQQPDLLFDTQLPAFLGLMNWFGEIL